MNEKINLNISMSQDMLKKLEQMSNDSHSSLEKTFLKSIVLMDLAINSQKEGNKLAIINQNRQIVEEINGI